MEAYVDRYGPGRLWVIGVGAAVLLIALAAAVFPGPVYRDIIWQYYWGPVVADAQNYACIAWDGGAQNACSADTTGPEASPGYTWQSYAGYIPILIVMLLGILIGCAQAVLSMVASGALDGVITNVQANPWDSVAGVHLIREAGGTVTDIHGDPWRHDSTGIVASNGLIHDEVLAATRAIDGL